MAVESMQMVSIIGKFQQLEDVIEACLDAGCFHPESTADITADVKGFSQINDENPYGGRLQKFHEALDYCGIKPELVPIPEDLSDDDVDVYINRLDKNLHTVQTRRDQLQKEIAEKEYAITQLQHFYSLDIPLDKVFSSEFIKVRFGRLPVESYEKLRAYRPNPYILFVPCSHDDSYYWGMYLAPLDGMEEVDRIFASLFFEQLQMPESTGTPQEAVAFLEKRLDTLRGRLREQDKIIDRYFTEHREECMQLYSQVKRNYDAFELRRYASRYGRSFMLLGWVPESQLVGFKGCIDRVDGIEVEYSRPEQSKRFEPPTKLRNRKPFRPFEYYVKLYGVPNYREADPTALVAITYTILFGIMFADLGQGIVLAIAGWLMWKLKRMDVGKILIPCGICGAFFGCVFGSVFGYEDLLNPLYRLLGFEEKPIDVMEDATYLLAFSIGIGVVLVLVAMIANVYSSLKRRDYGSAFFGHNGLAGILLYGSILGTAAVVVTGVNFPVLPLVLVGILLPVVLIFFKEPLGKLAAGRKDWKPEKWGDYILENIFELFEIILSYLTNTVSFLRVGAFVLVHAGMMMVFFSLADILPPGVDIVMIVFGNAFVTVLEGLLVSIQVLRLEFYEMFSRFYIGEGHPFEPVAVKAE